MAAARRCSIRLGTRQFLIGLIVISSIVVASRSIVETIAMADDTDAKSSRDQTYSGVWTGEYRYPEGSGQRPVPFDAIVVQLGQKLIGEIKETNTFGQQTEPWLHATLIGTIDQKSGEFQFTKTYDGTGGTSHDVAYKGRFSADSGIAAEGSWKLGDNLEGKFTLKKKSRLKAKTTKTLETVAGLWIGEYQYDAAANAKPVAFVLVLAPEGDRLTGEITEPNTFGDKTNAPWLHASVEAQVDPETLTLRFLKTYDGTGKVQHDVRYEGKLSPDLTVVKQGIWRIGTDQGQGTFSIKKELDNR